MFGQSSFQVNNNTVSGIPNTGLTIPIFTTQILTVADASTLFFGYWNGNLGTGLATTRFITVGLDCTISLGVIEAEAITAGSNEAWDMFIRVNDTTDYLLATVSQSSNRRTWINSALNIPLFAGDNVVVKSVAPIFITNPASVIFSGYLKC